MDADNVKKKMLRLIDRKAIYLMVHSWSDHDGPQRGVFSNAAAIFSVRGQLWRAFTKKFDPTSKIFLMKMAKTTSTTQLKPLTVSLPTRLLPAERVNSSMIEQW